MQQLLNMLQNVVTASDAASFSKQRPHSKSVDGAGVREEEDEDYEEEERATDRL